MEIAYTMSVMKTNFADAKMAARKKVNSENARKLVMHG